MISNTALADELEAVNSIYDADTLTIVSGLDCDDDGNNNESSSVTTVLNLPGLPFSFNVDFPGTYPDLPPHIAGTQSTGPNTRKGEGDAAVAVLRDALGRLYMPGQVCLFDLIEEVTPLLSQQQQNQVSLLSSSEVEIVSTVAATPWGSSHDDKDSRLSGTVEDIVSSTYSDSTAVAAGISTTAEEEEDDEEEPEWTLSQPLLVSKSSFVARAAPAQSLAAATRAVAHLLSTNKKVAAATHNITAWRIRFHRSDDDPAKTEPVVIQDCDDDGESAAGGRVLHLMQLMDAWNVVVVVTRWYGGVKLGPDRFRCINVVARDALVRGGFAKDDAAGGKGGKDKGKKKKRGHLT